jgi:hypothetical protein
MAPKAVDARKRHDRYRRFRGHGPLLQRRAANYMQLAHQRSIYNGPSMSSSPRSALPFTLLPCPRTSPP